MPRKRTSTAPLKRKTRLDNSEQINSEIKRLYRRCENKEITEITLNRRVDALKTLRSGMPEPTAKPTEYIPPEFHVHPVASGTFLMPEVCEELKQTGRLPEGALITLLEPADAPQSAEVIPLRALTRTGEPASVQRRIYTEAELRNMSMHQLMRLVAARADVSLEEVETMTLEELAARMDVSLDN